MAMPRAGGGHREGGGRFLQGEVTMYMAAVRVEKNVSYHLHSGERVAFDSPLYRGTSLTGRRTPLGPYGRTMPRVLGGS